MQLEFSIGYEGLVSCSFDYKDRRGYLGDNSIILTKGAKDFHALEMHGVFWDCEWEVEFEAPPFTQFLNDDEFKELEETAKFIFEATDTLLEGVAEVEDLLCTEFADKALLKLEALESSAEFIGVDSVYYVSVDMNEYKDYIKEKIDEINN